MKKFSALLLALVMALTLCACKSEEVKNAESLITAIGEVTLDSEAAILAAEEAYAAIPEEDKEGVENYAELAAARTAFDAAQAARISELITAIGEVTLDSEAAILAAEEAYAALREEVKALVSNSSVLTDARAAYEAAVVAAKHEEARLALVGNWLNEVIGTGTYPNILEDTNCEPRLTGTLLLNEDGTFTAEDEITGNWTLSEDMATVTLNAEGYDPMSFSIYEEDGFTKLNGTLFDNEFFAYVLEENFQAAFDAKYVVVELTDDNFRDYIGDPVFLGSVEHMGENLDCYIYPSQAYDDGLVYLGCSCNVQTSGSVLGTYQNISCGFPVIQMWNVQYNLRNHKLGNTASGQMFYVKADHVAENFIGEDGCRTLILTNGVTLVFDGYHRALDTFWSAVEASYEDNKY